MNKIVKILCMGIGILSVTYSNAFAMSPVIYNGVYGLANS